MDFYYDNVDFENKLQTIFDEFCREHGLVLYQGNNIFFLDQKNPKPSYLGNLVVSYTPTYLLGNLTNKSGNDWSHCKIPKQYIKPFVEAFYKKMDIPQQRYLRVLNKYFTKISPPELIAEYLVVNKPTLLEDFVTVPKMASSQSWRGDEIFKYLETIFCHKNEEEKVQILKKTFKNNKFLFKGFEFQEKLQAFIQTHVGSKYHEDFVPLYKSLNQYVEDSANIFNKPSNTFLLDINKVALYKKIKFQTQKNAQGSSYEVLIKSMEEIFKSKKIAARFNVDNLTITQKTSKFSNYRLNFNGLSNKKMDEEKIKEFIGLFFEAYSNSFSLNAPKKEDLMKMTSRLVLSFELTYDLDEKQKATKKIKI